jgi:hypothetical protein
MKYRIFLLIFFFVFCLLVSTFYKPVYRDKLNILNIGIIIDQADHFEALSTWLDDLKFNHLTFIVIEGVSVDYILNNATRIAKLQQYGNIIPRMTYMQLDIPDTRKTRIDAIFAKFKTAIGLYPKGIFMFQPDTYTCNYVKNTYDVLYVQGYCFDQYAIDYMTMIGGWQMPYFASPSHALIPNNNSGGIVVFPHVTWDWVKSFDVTHGVCTHPINLINFTFRDIAKGKTYFLSEIENTMIGSEPFGYVSVEFEFMWSYEWGVSETEKDWLKSLLTAHPFYSQWSYEYTAVWFNDMYRYTPTYGVHYTSPQDTPDAILCFGTIIPMTSESIEWYYDINVRVARKGNYVVSYVNYRQQAPDKYLTTVGIINWLGASQQDPNNCIDNSLQVKIRALGGAFDRAPILDDAVYYTGDLKDFASYEPLREFPTISIAIVGSITTCLSAVVVIISKQLN